jgi:hypothetical protein
MPKRSVRGVLNTCGEEGMLDEVFVEDGVRRR